MAIRFRSGRPMAVGRPALFLALRTLPTRVVPLKVLPKQRMPLWLRPHVLQERLETITPPLAHRDAQGPVPGITIMVGVEAPSLDGTPSLMFWGSRSAVPVVGMVRPGLAGATIVGLLLLGGPAHIPWLVPLFIVNSIQAVRRRGTGADVLIESHEVPYPRRMDLDATASPIRVVRTAGIETSVLHSQPRTIFRRADHPMLEVRGSIGVSRTKLPLCGCSYTMPSSIVVLNLACDPTYISGLVSLFIVNSVQAVFGRRPRTNIFEERLEVVHPSSIYTDATTPIIRVVSMVGIQAALLDLLPALILGELTMPMLEVHTITVTQTERGSSQNVSERDYCES